MRRVSGDSIPINIDRMLRQKRYRSSQASRRWADDDLLISAGTVAEALIAAARRNVGEQMERLIDGLGFGAISAPRRILSASHLFQTYRYPAHCSRHFGADPWAVELQDHAIGILQLNGSRSGYNGPASSDRAESAFNRSRTSQVEGPSDQPGCRGSDREADAHARYSERILLASQGQHAFTATDSDDEPAFGEYDGDMTGFGPRWRAEASYACEQGHQGDVYANFFHDGFPLKRLNATPTYSATGMAKYLNTASRMTDALRIGKVVGIHPEIGARTPLALRRAQPISVNRQGKPWRNIRHED